MRRSYLKIVCILLFFNFILFGCKGKTSKKELLQSLKNSKNIKVKDVFLEEWKKELTQAPYLLNIAKVVNPFKKPEKFLLQNNRGIPLKLVGIVKKGSKYYALMEDQQNTGYMVKENEKIGNVKILKIGKNYVIILQKFKTVYGTIKYVKRTLSLSEE